MGWQLSRLPRCPGIPDKIRYTHRSTRLLLPDGSWHNVIHAISHPAGVEMVEDHPAFLNSWDLFDRFTGFGDQSRLGALTLGLGRSDIHRGAVCLGWVYDYRKFFYLAQT